MVERRCERVSKSNLLHFYFLFCFSFFSPSFFLSLYFSIYRPTRCLPIHFPSTNYNSSFWFRIPVWRVTQQHGFIFLTSQRVYRIILQTTQREKLSFTSRIRKLIGTHSLLVCRTSYIMYHITTYMFKKNVNGFLENEEMNKWNKNLKTSSKLLWFYILWKQLFHHLNQAFEWV